VITMGNDEPRSARESANQARLASEPPTPGPRLDREREWLEREVAWAANLTDADRVHILRDLLRTADAIRRGKTPGENRRAEEVRRLLDEPGRARYRALIERLTGER
jgi:hypothetical protein